jgi:hypothetical protein
MAGEVSTWMNPLKSVGDEAHPSNCQLFPITLRNPGEVAEGEATADEVEDVVVLL